jgi:hypothetical protein
MRGIAGSSFDGVDDTARLYSGLSGLVSARASLWRDLGAEGRSGDIDLFTSGEVIQSREAWSVLLILWCPTSLESPPGLEGLLE